TALPVRAGAAPAAGGPRAAGARRSADVVIVGAGLAGLTAARDLVAAGRSVVVLEARDRVGGRVLNVDVGGGVVTEGGAEFIGPTQDRIAALAADVGVDTYPTYNTGSNVYFRNGTATPYSATGPLGPVPPDPLGIVDAEKAILALDDMAKQVPLDAPWTAPKATEWDGQTFETWKLANTTTDSGRFLLDVAITSIFSCEPRDVSLLFVLFYLAAAGDESNPGTIERLVNTAGGAQERRFVGGSQLVPDRVAQALGSSVVLSRPVRRLVTRKGTVTAVADGLRVTAARAIVAVPPPLAARIDYHPQLPALRDQLTQRMPMGTVVKVHAVYPQPFWRAKGLTGQAVADTPPAQVTFDNTPPEGSPGILMAFVEASAARARLGASRDALRRDVLKNFSDYFGPEAASPTAFHVSDWQEDPWSRGCPVCFTAPGVLLDYGRAIREPVGRIHWAGTETATFWNGYMDGAVRSGERAAREVLAAL
ncbi:MAG: monoamine oxidase, partial [Solirubrobacteraceae bacterium]|nr:monoamine oxidase [Solirubrobacteraceae bacterium]